MTTMFASLAVLVILYRLKRRLFTRAEGVLLAFWLIHMALEFGQLFFDLKSYHFEIRFFQPADFLTYGWLAWGITALCSKHLGRIRTCARIALISAGALILVYDAILLVKPRLSVGRRGAYVAACNWAADLIRADWRRRLAVGAVQAMDDDVFDIHEYRVPNRPVVDCYSARVPYLVGGRSNGIDSDARTAALDVPDYWIQDLRTDDPPGEGWELMETFRRGKYVLPLYRRADEK